MSAIDMRLDHVMELFWFNFLTSVLVGVLVLVIVYWYLNYKY